MTKLVEFAAQKGLVLPGERSWHALFVGEIARVLRPKAYLEVGVYRGETFRAVAKWSNRSVGVDIDANAGLAIKGLRGSSFFLGSLTSASQALEKLKEPFDLIFIDADHAKESVVSDFDIASKLLSQNGLILLHDTWPLDSSFLTPNLCGDAWLAVNLLRSRHPEWSFVTMPAHPGLTICQRNSASPF